MSASPYKDALLNTELARPIGIVTGTRVGGGPKKQRDRCIALSDLTITYADGSTKIVPRRSKPNRVRVVNDRKHTLDLIRSLPSIGDSNH